MRGPSPSRDERKVELSQQDRPNDDCSKKQMTADSSTSNISDVAEFYHQSQKKEENDDNNNVVNGGTGTPIWKIGRVLVDSLSKGKMRRVKIFGAPLEDLPLNNHGLPKIAQRLCLFIENYGLVDDNLFTPCKKQTKFIERYKISFERIGDADLENSPNVKIVAALLKIWLRELPHPLISPVITGKLIAVCRRYNCKDIYDINAEISNGLWHLPMLNLGVLYVVMRLLHRYTITKCYCELSDADHLPEMFAPILMRESTTEHVQLVTTMINHFADIFNDRVIDKVFRFHLNSERKYYVQKVSTRQMVLLSTESTECNRPVAYHLVDKLIRSNSEEKLSPDKDDDPTLGLGKDESSNRIRRVSSHEDFSKHSKLQHPIKLLNIITEYNADMQSTVNGRFLMNANDKNGENITNEVENMIVDKYEMSEVQVAPPPIGMIDDNEQEKIRDSERFSPQYSVTKKNSSARKRKKYSQATRQMKNFTDAIATINSIKINNLDDFRAERDDNSCTSDIVYQDNDLSPTSSSSSSSSSPTTSTSSSVVSSPVKSPLSPERAYHIRSNSEPLTSLHNWSLAHHPPDNAAHKDRSLSPRNSISRRSLSELSSLPRATNPSAIDLQVLNVSKHVHWLKKKMKRFEEDYYDKHGQFPSFCQKMTAPEYKQMSTSLIVLKNNLKQLKRESIENVLKKSHYDKENNLNSIRITTTVKEDVVKQVEKMMYESRRNEGRPERAEDMSYEQLEEEKLVIQKIIYHIERLFGQPNSRYETLFQPIYNHQRLIRRLLARSATSLKLKESSSDLATINENETMEFGSSDNTVSSSVERTTSPSVCQDYCIMSNIPDDTEHLHNIHSLSSHELMTEYKITKEKKRKLKSQLQMLEIEAAGKSVCDFQHCITSLRHRYKRVKAKLKLLDALLVKMK